MLGLDDYGSDSDTSDSGSSKPAPVEAPPPPKTKAKRKVAIGLPAFKQPDSAPDDNAHDEPEQPPAKKARITPGGGAGLSSLLSKLPAPKQAVPVPPKPERVLGGGSGPGLVFAAPSSSSSATIAPEPDTSGNTASTFSTAFLPPSVKSKGRSNVNLEASSVPKPPPSSSTVTAAPPKPATPAVDFFSLGTPSTSKPLATTSAIPSTRPKFSAAPALPTFDIPDPTPTDAYPGYYQLPSGTWAAHDPAFYNTFAKKWQAEYNAHIRALEKGHREGYDAQGDDMQEVNALEEMERAKEEVRVREERKNVTLGKGEDEEVAMPKMKITAAKQSGVARSRHQLSTMLMEAYTNREALEEKIADGRRNRKEAGNKYGF